MREIKFKVSAGQTTVGYELLAYGTWKFKEVDGVWKFGTFGNKAYKRWQYTGQKDKNGVEIYEADILSGYVNDYPIEVTWEPSMGGWYTNNNRDDEWGHTGTLSIGVAKHVEVIGNIYKTPDLIK